MAIKDFDTEKPKSAIAVSAVLSAVTRPAPSLCVILSEKRLAATVPPEIIIETIPAHESGTDSSVTMVGHAAPSRESGSPRLINAM